MSRRAGKQTGGKVDWEKVRATTHEEIARQIEDEPDAAPALSRWDLSDAKLVRRLQPAQ